MVLLILKKTVSPILFDIILEVIAREIKNKKYKVFRSERNRTFYLQRYDIIC